MGSTNFGNFGEFCHRATLPVCNLLSTQHNQTGPWGGCTLDGISLSDGKNLTNLGTVILTIVAMAFATYLILRAETRKDAAVGRREMQLFLLGYIVVSFCEFFSVGGLPLNSSTGERVRIAFSGMHLAAITATTWVLLLNAVVGYQLMDDGTVLSVGLVAASATVFGVVSGYLALDTGFQWTGTFDSSYNAPNRNIPIYVFYQLLPLIFLVLYFILETILVLRILKERRPLLYLCGATLVFTIGQVLNYVVSPYICDGTSGKINGALFETFCTLVSVGLVWMFWDSITEDEWADVPATIAGSTTYP